MRLGTQKTRSGWLVGLSSILCVAANVPAFAGVDDGLVANYCFDDPANLAKDCSGNGNNGTLEGTVTAVEGTAKFGGYNNPADIHVKNSKSLQFNNALTISYKVKMTGLDGMDGWGSYSSYGAHAVVAKSHDRSGFVALVGGDDKGNFSSWFQNNVYSSPSITTGGSISNFSLADWVHIAYVISKDSGEAKFYMNGALLNTESGAVDFSIANGQDLYIGKFSDSWFPLNGSLDDVRLYNRALSEKEIQELSSMGNTVSGSANGLEKTSVTCKNLATGDKVSVPKVKSTWDCEAAGLTVAPGEKIQITIKGTSDH